MGTISDFVIAEPSEAKAIGESFQPSEKWPTLTGWKGVESIKLSTLYCSMSCEEYSNDLQKTFELVGGDKYEGPWVFQFPKHIQEFFARFDILKTAEVAAKWAATEELEMDRWSTDDAEQFIKQVCEHAKKADNTNKSLFLWFSL